MMGLLSKSKSYVFTRVLLLTAMVLLSSTVHLQAQTVSGVVRDNSGETLAGVTILRNGDTRTGVVTDADGRYTIAANGTDVLTYSYVGMKSQRQTVNNRRRIDVTLQAEAQALGDVVVVGYGQVRRQSLTGAVSAIKGDELLRGPLTNVSSVLAGKLPGLLSVQTSGEPGNDQAQLAIRGSFYSPLCIVDGMPRSINDIDPNDIESISVLKDAASAAVYGLDAAGGAIIITTHRGREGATQVSYDGQYGVSVNANFPRFMNGPEYADYYNMADLMDKLTGTTVRSRDDYTPVFSRANIEAMLNGDPTDGWDNVDYIGKVFGTGTNMKHNLSVQGGNDRTHYYLSAGYMRQQGNIDNYNYRRYNLRTNIDTRLGRHWQLTFGAAGTVGRRSTPGYASGGSDSDADTEVGWLSVGHQAIMMHPFLPETWQGRYTATIPSNAAIAYSPLAAIYQSGYKKTRSMQLNSNITIEYEAPWLPGLKLKATGAYDYLSSMNKNLDTPYQTYSMSMASDSFGTFVLNDDPRSAITNLNHVGQGENSTEELTGQLSAEFARRFGKHNVDALLLVEGRDYKGNVFAAYAYKVPFAQLPELSFGTPIQGSPLSGSSDHTRKAGYVFRLKYDYANTYLAEVSGRYDGSYNFSGNESGKRWGFFPSVSTAWRLSEEAFMRPTRRWLSDLKLRASLGLMGNDGVPAYSFLSTYSFGANRMIGGTAVSSLYTTGIPNTSLTWSKTRSTGIGLDATLWDGLLGLTVDVFYNYNYNLLAAMGGDMSPSMGGYYPTWKNHNAYDIRGLELALSHRNRVALGGKPLNYNVNWNMTYTKSKWLKYPDSPNTQSWRKVVGTSVDAYNAWVADGLFRTEDEITQSAWYGTRPNLGDIKYRDLNGDGKIDEQDKARIGRSNRPQVMMGLNLVASWNGFDLAAQFTAGLKFDVSLLGTYYNGYDDNTVWSQTFKEGANSPLWLVQDSYSIDNPNATYPRLTLGNTSHGGDNGLASTFWMMKGDYLRLKTLQLGYTLPRAVVGALGLQRVRVYVEGSNLFTIDSLPAGVDPESPRVNNGYYPQQRTYMGGINITF